MTYAWINGELVSEAEARVPVADRGFLYGEGCFETVRIRRGLPFRLDAHLRRLEEGMRLFGFEPPWPLPSIRDGARALVTAQAAIEAVLRIIVTAPHPETGHPGTAAITIRAPPTVPREVRLHVSPSVRRIPGLPSRCKMIARGAEALALREARAAGAFDAILLNPQGNVAETASRNVFIVSGDEVQTPSVAEGAFEGITRGVVMELARRFDRDVREVPVPLNALMLADEVFLTGTSVGVCGVSGVHAHRYHDAPGMLTQRLVHAYDEVLTREAAW